MASSFRPMLAGKAPEEIQFPVYASAKLDGIRCIIINGVAMSRNLKPIPNKYVQKVIHDAGSVLEGMDGELIVGLPYAKNAFSATTSGVMSEDGQPDFFFFIFDNIKMPLDPFVHRYSKLEKVKMPAHCGLLRHTLFKNSTDLAVFEREQLAVGFEGLCLRSVNGHYKYGRSSTKEGILLKLKRYADSEAVVTGFTELMHNDNEATEDALGHTSRTTHKDNMVGMDIMGALVVEDMKTKIKFQIGTGFSQEQRKLIWENRNNLKGKIVKYKHFEVGVKDAPRFPVFIGFRDPRDMS